MSGELASREWLAGDAFSIADITALSALDFARLSEVRVTAERPHLHRWYAAINARPSARA